MMLLRSDIKKRFLTSVAIGAYAVCFVASGGVAQASNLAPQGQWKISEFKGGNPEKDSYCALIQPYSEDIFLSLGRNILGEYSIAMDFKNGGLQPDKAYSVSLQPGPGQIRAYELMPTSPRAMVIRLGYDDSFFKTFKQSKQLKAEIDDQAYVFNFPDIAGGQDKLSICMASLKETGSTTQVADIAFQAEKIETPVNKITKAVPQAVESISSKKEAIKKELETIVAEPAIKIEKAVEITKPKLKEPIDVAKIIAEPVETKIESKAEAPVKPISIARVSRAVADTAEKPIVFNTERSATKISKVAETIGQTGAQKKQREALNRLKTENERLNQALKVEMTKPAEKVPDRTQEVVSLKSEIDKLQSELASVQSNKNEIDTTAQEELTALQRENKKLKETVKTISERQEEVEKANALKLVEAQKEAQRLKISKAEVLKPVDEVLVKQLDNLKSENARLSAALQGQEAQISQFDARSPGAEKELEAMRIRLSAMEAENKKLIVDARKARGKIDTAVVDVGNQAFKKIREYEKRLEAAQADNLTLSREIEQMRRVEEDDRLKSVSGDWNLEKSTKRYNEAEREIKRLGMLLEQQRVASRQEKTELEGMLFDPAVTEIAQRKKMSELQEKLANAERQLRQRGLAVPQTSGESNLYTRATGEERVYIGAAPKVERAPTSTVTAEPKVSAYKPVSASISTTSRRPAVSRVFERVTPAIPAVQSTALSFGASNVQTLLNRAGVSAGAISAASNNQYVWRNGNVQGTAFTSRASSLNDFANKYIAEQRQSCSGDFASLPSGSSSAQAVGFDIACVGASDNKASSLVFTRQGSEMVAIAHETSADDMDSVIDIRDRILSSL